MSGSQDFPRKIVDVSERKNVTELGDCWQIGKHRLICGDCTSPETIRSLFADQQADLLFTSPPYDNQRVYTVGSFNWTELMCGMAKTIPYHEETQVLINLGVIHSEGQWQPYWDEWLKWMPENGWRRFGLYVWDQGEGLPGGWNGRLAPCFEFVFHFNKKPRKPNKIIPCIYAGHEVSVNQRGGIRTKSGKEVAKYIHAGKPVQEFKIPGSLIRVHREHVSGIHREHPAVFPVKFPEFVIRAYSNEDEIVYEPFSGSGTTIIAADNTNRICYAAEISPEYVDITIRRWLKMFPSGDKPLLEGTGNTFEQVAAFKGVELPDDNKFREVTGTQKHSYEPQSTLEDFF